MNQWMQQHREVNQKPISSYEMFKDHSARNEHFLT